MIPKLKRGVSAVRARNSTLPRRWPCPCGMTIGSVCIARILPDAASPSPGARVVHLEPPAAARLPAHRRDHIRRLRARAQTRRAPQPVDVEVVAVRRIALRGARRRPADAAGAVLALLRACREPCGR